MLRLDGRHSRNAFVLGGMGSHHAFVDMWALPIFHRFPASWGKRFLCVGCFLACAEARRMEHHGGNARGDFLELTVIFRRDLSKVMFDAMTNYDGNNGDKFRVSVRLVAECPCGFTCAAPKLDR